MSTDSPIGRRDYSFANETEPALENDESTDASDVKLVLACRRGSQVAWCDLVDKYRNLIFGIPIRYGFSPDECADIFQDVCLELLRELSRLREPQALPKWLMQVCSHKCYHWRRKRERVVPMGEESLPDKAADSLPDVRTILQDAQSDQLLHEAIARMPSRCQEMIQMLFFEEPSLRYREVAERLSIAQGSVAAIRQRCLGRLGRVLRDLGF